MYPTPVRHCILQLIVENDSSNNSSSTDGIYLLPDLPDQDAEMICITDDDDLEATMLSLNTEENGNVSIQ